MIQVTKVIEEKQKTCIGFHINFKNWIHNHHSPNPTHTLAQFLRLRLCHWKFFPKHLRNFNPTLSKREKGMILNHFMRLMLSWFRKRAKDTTGKETTDWCSHEYSYKNLKKISKLNPIKMQKEEFIVMGCGSRILRIQSWFNA